MGARRVLWLIIGFVKDGRSISFGETGWLLHSVPPRHTGPRFCRLAIEMQLKLLHPLLYCLFRPVVMGGGGGATRATK